MALQAYFFSAAIYGWWFWSKKTDFTAKTKIKRLTKTEWIVVTISIAVISVLVYKILLEAGGSLPMLDSITTAISIVAQVLLARKVLENWILWIAANCIYLFIFYQKELYPTLFLYLVLIGIAVHGWQQWRFTLANLTSESE